MFKDAFRNTVQKTLLKAMYLQYALERKRIHPLLSPWSSQACNRVHIKFLQKTQYSIDYKIHTLNSLVCSMMQLVAIMINYELLFISLIYGSFNNTAGRSDYIVPNVRKITE